MKEYSILGVASIDALSLATGPVKWQLELFTSKDRESVGFIHFDFHMEQFTHVRNFEANQKQHFSSLRS
jgi:hypothetical protein